MSYLKLGQILIKQGLITEEQLNSAITAQKQEPGRIGEILIKLGIIKEEDIVAALGKQLALPYASRSSGLLTPQPDQQLENLITKDFAHKNLVLPLSRNLNSLTCAVFDPLDLLMIDNLKKITGCEINLVLATRSDIVRAIEDFYSNTQQTMLGEAVQNTYGAHAPTASFAETVSADSTEEPELSLDKLIARAEEAPVVKLVDLIIRQAIDERASDVHIEPYKNRINLRYRIDGSLYEIPPPARHLHLPIISRIKILAKLDIAEKRLPQDGAIMVKLEDRAVDLRISTVPTIWGEKVVMRILDQSAVPLSLSHLGFEPKQLELIRKAIKSPYGLFFVTGPTGSGKSTTLYAALNECADPHKNIITIEDPVEFRIDGINQVNVKPDIGLTFASALRSFLRQDPDTIMVGEVRDLETAQICVRAALTGHFVLSTLHTNDAASAVTRLLDIGIESYLLMPSLVLILAQRLARKLCPKCKEAYEPTPEQLGGLKLKADLIYRAKGCAECNQTGYRGRVCVAETMAIDSTIRGMVSSQASYVQIKDAARKNGMDTLFESGIKKVEAGVTSLEEILSVTLS
ncbi:MAG TPA: ATPase, T2SS/T4P/T4SS family [Candidatus Omnitrophota bacterium]|nr:ATPase, T2SS/T4P/T4SS family [Candidatus Omnitrophota bacterium]HPD85314.1 ATPase, T2SS/T4P/T4SS family [Candidatus Omnitrophota bacterium]HRZ04185.1 ATPase, T2SS/T4P/T4SS family [Candidatus Omnitrophota bacterium]